MLSTSEKSGYFLIKTKAIYEVKLVTLANNVIRNENIFISSCKGYQTIFKAKNLWHMKSKSKASQIGIFHIKSLIYFLEIDL